MKKNVELLFVELFDSLFSLDDEFNLPESVIVFFIMSISMIIFMFSAFQRAKNLFFQKLVSVQRNVFITF